MPILLPLALISGMGIVNIANKNIKTFIIVMIVFIGSMQFYAISYGVNWLPKRIEIDFPGVRYSDPFPQNILLFNQEIPIPSGGYSQPTIEKPYYREALDAINSNRPKDKRIKITVIPDLAPLWGYFQYRAFIDNLPFDIFCDAQDIYFLRPINFSDLILGSDYIITKEGGWLSDFYLEGKIKQAMQYFYTHKDRFSLISTIEISEEETIFIYKKNKL